MTVRAKIFGHAFRIDTSGGRKENAQKDKVFRAARQAEPVAIPFAKPPEKCSGSVKRRMGGLECMKAMGPEEGFFVTIVLSFVSTMFTCGRAEGKGEYAWRIGETIGTG